MKIKNLANHYARIYQQLQELLTKTEDQIARMATIAALLQHKMPHFFWTGFYLVKNDCLIVGPYQGPLACQVLERKKGACWASVLQKKTLVVPDIRKFSDHIACDSRSNSEIVIPLIRDNGTVWGVLDVDSVKFNAFSEIDSKWLEKIAALLNRHHFE